MKKEDEQILRAYFKLEEYQGQRLRFERLLHPEKFKWSGPTPTLSQTKKIRIDELGKIGFGESFYQKMAAGEQEAKKELEDLAENHPLWAYIEPIHGFARYLAGAFIAAGGDIERPPTCSAFWKGMGLDVLADGTVPRRTRAPRSPGESRPSPTSPGSGSRSDSRCSGRTTSTRSSTTFTRRTIGKGTRKRR